MTIEKNLRHAIPSNRYAVTPTPDFRWIADSAYLTFSGSSPQRVQTWTAANGGYTLHAETARGPKADALATQGVFFEGAVAHPLRTWMSSSSTIETGISHSFVVIKMQSSSAVASVSVGFSNANNHYLILNTGAVWAATSISASVITFSHTSNLSSTPGWKGTTSKNIVNYKFRGVTTAERTYIGFNSASMVMMAQNVAGFGAFKTGNSKIRFGRRSNTNLATNDDAPYSGSIYDVLLYTTSLTNAQTGSIITQLMTIWGIT